MNWKAIDSGVVCLSDGVCRCSFNRRLAGWCQMDSLHQMPEIFLMLRLLRASISIGPDISDELRNLREVVISLCLKTFLCSLKEKSINARIYQRTQKQRK